MKKVFVLFYIILMSNCYSQNAEISIVLKDADSNLPIEDASVYVLKTKQILQSNSDGVVTFMLNGISNIQITQSSYQSLTVRSNTLKNQINVVLLKSIVKDLDEIIITKQHPQKILKNIVENSIKKLTTPARLKVYSREFFKLNGTYSYYNDGLMNFQISGKEKDFKTDILVEQNRSFSLLESADINNYLLGYDLNNIMENYYNFNYLASILEPKAKKEFDFLIKSYTANSDYYVMLITPLNDAKGLLDEYVILYDKKKKLIIEVSSSVSPSMVAKTKDKTAIGSKNINKSLFKNIYRHDDSNYYLVSSKEEIGFEKIDKKGTSNIEVRNYFVVTNFSDQKYSFKESDVFKDKALFNKKNVILTDYWNVSGLTATDEEQEIINSIEEQH
jgi:vacuolar-type H+-ATPase subunit F/Vma7